MRLQLDRLLDGTWSHLEHLHRSVAANLGRPDDLPLAVATCEFRQGGDVAGPNPFPRSRITEAKRVELDRRHGQLHADAAEDIGRLLARASSAHVHPRVR